MSPWMASPSRPMHGAAAALPACRATNPRRWIPPTCAPPHCSPTISTIVDRGYIAREKKQLVPTELGFVVNRFMMDNFDEIVDVQFTASMENDLDGVEEDKVGWADVLGKFYGPFHKKVEIALEKAPPELRALPWNGPTLLSLRPLKDAKEQFDSTMLATRGVPQAAQPELWQAYDAARAAILETARPVEGLKTKYPAETALIDSAITKTGKPADRLLYMPVLSRDTAWSVLIDAETARPVGFVPLDPS